jgi:predicted transcriptional regulator
MRPTKRCLYYNVRQIGLPATTMQTPLAVRLADNEAQTLDALCAATGKSRSEIVRESLREYQLRHALRTSQSRLGGLARSKGWLTEDDVLNSVS